MTPEEREILERVAMLAEENNAILKKTLRRSRIGTAFHFFYWLVIIGVSVASYYYLQPYVEKMIPLFNSAVNTVNEINAAKGM